ncbi:MAG: low molecular weight phosphatase family protein [Nitrospinota bacterium]
MNVLIVCCGNTCRSPMAEAIAQKLLGDTATVQSAGTETTEGLSATREAITVMHEMGFDIRNHRSRDIEHLDLAEFSRIIAMTPAIASRLRTLGVESQRYHRASF